MLPLKQPYKVLLSIGGVIYVLKVQEDARTANALTGGTTRVSENPSYETGHSASIEMQSVREIKASPGDARRPSIQGIEA